MCYTCTFSLCKSCTKDAAILSVRGNKGFCETCMRTVMLIENNEHGNNDVSAPLISLSLSFSLTSVLVNNLKYETATNDVMTH